MITNNSKITTIWNKFLTTDNLYQYYKSNKLYFSSTTSFSHLILAYTLSVPSNLSLQDFQDHFRNKNINTTSRMEETIRIKLEIPSKIQLSPRQIEINNICPIGNLFRIARKIPSRPHAHFMWKFLQGSLNFDHKQTCEICNLPTNHKHLLFNCKKTEKIVKTGLSISTLLTESRHNKEYTKASTPPTNWDHDSILLFLSNNPQSNPHSSIIIITLRTIWEQHIHSIHNPEFPFKYKNFIIDSLNMFINAQITNIKALYQSLTKIQSKTNQLHYEWNTLSLFSQKANNFYTSPFLNNFIQLN